MESKELIEKLANLEHEQWSHWTRYFIENYNGENLVRWSRQVITSYPNLSEKEKESDREWAKKSLQIFREMVNRMSCSEKESSLNFKVRLINLLKETINAKV